MFAIEYRHRNSLRPDPWKSLKLIAHKEEQAERKVSNLETLYGQDWDFRVVPYQVIGTVKPLTGNKNGLHPTAEV